MGIITIIVVVLYQYIHTTPHNPHRVVDMATGVMNKYQTKSHPALQLASNINWQLGYYRYQKLQILPSRITQILVQAQTVNWKVTTVLPVDQYHGHLLLKALAAEVIRNGYIQERSDHHSGVDITLIITVNTTAQDTPVGGTSVYYTTLLVLLL